MKGLNKVSEGYWQSEDGTVRIHTNHEVGACGRKDNKYVVFFDCPGYDAPLMMYKGTLSSALRMAQARQKRARAAQKEA